MLITCWKVECLPVSEGSCWQIGIVEGRASFHDDGHWLSEPGGPEFNFDARLKEKKNTLAMMPAITKIN